MVRILHLGDVHLGASFSAFGDAAETRIEQVHEAFRALPDLAREESAHVVVIAGDLFNGSQPPAALAAMARETARRLVDAGLPVFIVPGNHDPVTTRPSPYHEPFGGAHVFTEPAFGAPVTIETADGTPLHVSGVAFDPSREPDPLSTFRRAETPGLHIVVMHGSVDFCPHWEASPNALGLSLETLEALGADYIALGDYHRFRPPERFRVGDRTVPACYCGSFAALDLTEAGPRGVAIVDLEPDAPPVVRLRPVGVPPVEVLGDLDVTFSDSEVAVANAVADRVSTPDVIPAVTLTGTPSFPLDAAIVEAELRERFPWARVVDQSLFFASQRLEALAASDTIVAHVVRLGRARVEAASTGGQREVAERALRLALQTLGVG